MKNNLFNFVKIYNNALPEKLAANILDICKSPYAIYEGALLTTKKEIPEIRSCSVWHLNNIISESKTNQHLCNIFKKIILQIMQEYIKEYSIEKSRDKIAIESIQVLKYEIGGHYIYHSDDSMYDPRFLSFVYLLNDDYEGGELVFKSWDNDTEEKIEVVKNTVIVFPSNFLYVHKVKPVTKGTKYSIVSWIK